MENTRKPRLSDPPEVLVEAVGVELAQRLLSLRVPRIAVACSGGRDSMVLLDILARLRDRASFELLSFHVHHGLSPHADAWAEQVRSTAAALGVTFDMQRVGVVAQPRMSIEEVARDARYQALDAMAQAHGVGVLALAHHADDQAETLLLQLTRGAGVSGLAAMPMWAAPEPQRAARWRPLLLQSSADIASYVQAHGVCHVNDESNDDVRLLRNALRHEVIPALLRHAPGAVGAISRSARLLQAALALEHEIAAEDLAVTRLCEGLSISALARLSAPRRANAMRLWIDQLGARMPSELRLDEVWRQVSNAQPNAQPAVRHEAGHFVRYRDLLAYAPLEREAANDVLRCWAGQGAWRPRGWAGEFRFLPAAQGVPEARLGAAALVARRRHGAERLSIATGRPRRDLKHWYQEFGIPVWQRKSAPILWLGDSVLHVPFVGTAVEFENTMAPCRAIVWHPDGEGSPAHV